MLTKLADVDRAFLYAKLDHEVYLQQPKGLDDGSGRDLRLRKALYGLKQSPREWGKELESLLLEHGFIKPNSDHAIFMMQGAKGRVYLATWVDDILIVAELAEGVKMVKKTLKKL